MRIAVADIIPQHLFDKEEELRERYADDIVQRILRVREMYNYINANPEETDKGFVDEETKRYGISKKQAYDDLNIIKSVLPNLAETTREYHRWRFNEMILETYQMAKARKDTRTMEKAATSYAKMNRISEEDALAIPYEQIVVQPFTATTDPTVLGLKPIPDIDRKIRALIEKYTEVSADIQDVEYEPADIQIPMDDEEQADELGRDKIL